MAFAVHINMKRCTGGNNCVVACPWETRSAAKDQ
nr:4Fe-4S binding protein [uncultured Methanoregula sp.]